MISLSTHVLDTGGGEPAAGVRSSSTAATCSSRRRERTTTAARRLADELDPGTYRLVFHPPSPFFRRVELEVELDEGHYHVPLLVSPYACASYRGS